MTETMPKQEGAESPRLYRQTEIVSLQRHGDLGMVAQGSFDFARKIVSVPASLSEMVLCQRHYPIVFAGPDAPRPIIVLGLAENEGNLFVTEKGAWAQNVYVPAFLRRYPFVAVPNGPERLALAADMQSDLIERGGARPLFEDGKPSDVAHRAFDFCARLDADFSAAQEFAAALAEAGLLHEEHATIKSSGAVRARLANFQLVDETLLDALSDETFLEWRRRGWLAPIHAHLMSVSSWSELVHRQAALSTPC